MSPPKIQPVNRRGFIATMTVTAVALGASALRARDASAVSVLASMPVDPRRSGALVARHGPDEAAPQVHHMGANPQSDQRVSSNAQCAARRETR